MKPNPKDALAKATPIIQRGTDALNDRASKARDAVAEAAKKTRDAADDIAEQTRKMNEARRRKKLIEKYNPIFPQQYADFGNDRPKMIVIEDEAERKDIEVCDGSIGWLGKSAGVEVLHLYEEAVPFSGIEFNPPAECGAVYYENKLVSGRYISMDSYFDVIQRDMFTELRRIAYELGARKCVLESYEEAKIARVAHAGAGRKGKGPALLKKTPMMVNEVPDNNKTTKTVETSASNGESIDLTADYSSTAEKSIVFTQTFEGNANPKRPELKWFANDEEIKFLIDTRCNGEGSNTTKEYTAKLDSTSSQTMNVVLAAKLDKALGKLCSMYNFSLEGEAKAESRRKLIFKVEF